VCWICEPSPHWIKRLSASTTVIVGEEDVATPLPRSQKMANLIPDAHLHIIPDSGHSSPVEEPEAVTAVMQQFYRQVLGA
jgi:3-oxoadipate enol-lactonase